MKKLLSLILAALLLSGCSSNISTETSADTDTVDTIESATPSTGNEDIDVNTTASLVAAESPHHTITKGMMTYFFYYISQNYIDNAETYGIDTETPLSEQPCAYSPGTWFDYFMEQTRTYVGELTALCDAAYDKGMTVTAEEAALIESKLTELKEQFTVSEEYSKYAVDELLTLGFGSDIRLEDIRLSLEMLSIGTKFASEFGYDVEITKEDIHSYYETHRDYFDLVDALAFTLKVKDFGYTEGEDSTISLEDAKNEVKAYAERLAGAKSADDFTAMVKDYRMTVLGEVDSYAEKRLEDIQYNAIYKDSYIFSSEVSDWIFDAAAGETMSYTYDETYCTVYYLVNPTYRDENITRNMRHVLINAENYETEEDFNAAAEKVYSEWEKAGFTDEALAELAAKYSEDGASAQSGGLYENLAPGQVAREIDDWLFAEDRKAGDLAQLESVYGWHIILCLGEGEFKIWEAEVLDVMLTERYNNIIDTNMASMVFHDDVINTITG